MVDEVRCTIISNGITPATAQSQHRSHPLHHLPCFDHAAIGCLPALKQREPMGDQAPQQLGVQLSVRNALAALALAPRIRFAHLLSRPVSRHSSICQRQRASTSASSIESRLLRHVADRDRPAQAAAGAPCPVFFRLTLRVCACCTARTARATTLGRCTPWGFALHRASGAPASTLGVLRDSPASRSAAPAAVRACPETPAHPPPRPSAHLGTTPDPSTARVHR